MDDQDKRIADLESKTQENNQEFVQAELDACFVTVENGIHAFTSGNLEAARSHADKAEKGYQTVVEFVPELGGERQRAEFEKRWDDLRARLDTLQSMLKRSD